MLFIRKFPKLGIYVVMFTSILYTFMKFFLIFVLFLVAFALSFHTLLYDPGVRFISLFYKSLRYVFNFYSNYSNNNCRRRGGLMVSALYSESNGSGSRHGRGAVLCSWAIHFTLTVPLSTQVCKWVLANLLLGSNPAKG